MTRCLRGLLVLAAVALAGWAVSAAEPAAKDKAPDLSDFRTVDTALTTRISRTVAPRASIQPGYLGINLDTDSKGKLIVAQVEPDSPAAKAGLLPGDMLREVAGQKPADAAGLRELLVAKGAGETLDVALVRKDKPVELKVTLDAPSHPLSASGGRRAIMGVQLKDVTGGAQIDVVSDGLPAAEAGLKKDDVITKVDGTEVSGSGKLRDLLAAKKPGDTVTVAYKRGDKDLEAKVKLAADQGGNGPGPWDDRNLRTWRKEVYRLAVVPVEFPDVEHNAKVSLKDWETSLFSEKKYTDKSPTGQTVYGSLNDFYQEISCNTFRVEGKFFDWVAVSKKRDTYGNDSNRFALLTEALDKLLERDGKDALKDFDGLFFVYAGKRVQTQRGGLYWPHRSTVNHKGQRWAYFICPEGGDQMSSISVTAHEFGHMLGLPDLYAQQDSPAAEGLGVWCTMSTGHGRDGKPLHFSAWCKEQLGWLKPAVIDPTTKQKLILAPVEGSAKECYKVLMQADGSEYLLLENRVTKGFDRDLPGEGLLIWRVVDGHPVLEESHGVLGPAGPGSFLGSVPFPSKANTAFTPLTTPSSKSVKGGGLPVHITNIHKLPDGRITFWIGYEYL